MDVAVRTHTKDAAEGLLLELPSVVGAFVREDINGHPREVHLLIAPGPNPRHLARDVRDLLEERLGVPIDQRVISIAQLAVAPEDLDLDAAAGESSLPAATTPDAPAAEPRLRFQTLEAHTRSNSVLIRVQLAAHDRVFVGEDVAVDVGVARLRAAATAALNAACLACQQHMQFQLDGLTTIRAFGREYVLVSALASAASIGRRPLSLAGAQPLDHEPDHAAAQAALMAINRIISSALKS
jgi:hypothetical protein